MNLSPVILLILCRVCLGRGRHEDLYKRYDLEYVASQPRDARVNMSVTAECFMNGKALCHSSSGLRNFQ